MQELKWCSSLVPYLDIGVEQVISELGDFRSAGKGHWWFTPWEGHCRKAVHLFAAKGAVYYIEWGYNFDFIPQETEPGKFKYHRTEKAVTLHCADLFFRHIDYDPSKLTLNESHAIRMQYHLVADNVYEEFQIHTDADAIAYAERITRRNLPFMQEYFSRVKTVDDMIADLEQQIAAKPQLYLYTLHWNLAFLLAFRKRYDEAVKTIEFCYNKQIPQKTIDRLQQVYQLSSD